MMTVDYGAEKRPQRGGLFYLLSDLQWHTWKELRLWGGERYGARILELKRLGYQVESEPIPKTTGKQYRLASLEKGKPLDKRVKAFINPGDVEMFLSEGIVSPAMKQAIAAAYETFQANRNNL